MKSDELLIASFRRYASKLARESGGSPYMAAHLVYHAGMSMVNTAGIILSEQPDRREVMLGQLKRTVDECARAIDPNWVERPLSPVGSQQELNPLWQ